MQHRSFLTSSQLLVVAGKNAKQNEEVVKLAKSGDLILHTKAPGSPFCVVKASSDKKKVDEQSIKEAANFCAAFSKAWKQGKKQIEVHAFKPEDVYKSKSMPLGTYGVKKTLKQLKVKPEIGIGMKDKKLQCSPVSALDKVYIVLKQGKLMKEKAAEKIKALLEAKGLRVSKEQIMQLIPAGAVA